MNVGDLIIKTVMDNSKFEKQYKDLEKKANTKEIDIKVTTDKINKLEEDLKSASKKQQDFFKEYDELVAKRNAVDPYEAFGKSLEEDGFLKAHAGDLLNDYDVQIEQLEKKMQNDVKPTAEDITRELEKQKDVLKKQQTEYDTIKEKMSQIKLQEAQEGIKKFGKGVGNTIKSIGKMALAIFGIRSAFSFIRSSMSTLSQYDKQMASDLEYMRWAIATAIKPVIEWLIKAGFTLLNLLNALFYKLFGINLFAHATAKDFKNAKNSAGELKKTLAGFDEMNILNKNGTTGVATSLNFDVNDGINAFKKFKEDLKKINWEELANYIGDKITSTLTSQEFWNGVWETIKWTINNVFVFPADFMNNIIANLFSDNKTSIDNNGKLITEEKTYAEKIIGQLVGSILDQFNLKFNPLGWIISALNKSENEIKEEFDTSAKNFGGSYALAFIDAFLSGFTLYRVFKDTITSIVTLWNATIGKLTGKTITINVDYNGLKGYGGTAGGRAKGGIYYPSLPKLAVGGIINQPGKGIPYHDAVIGERGAEAVVPLTDSQQMELLGATIGKYITVYNTNPIYLNGRLIAKEINRSNAEDDFAFNR